MMQIFEYLNSLRGPFEVDWFASDSTYKLKLFYLRYWNVNVLESMLLQEFGPIKKGGLPSNILSS